ncbi:YihY/virulence factor BrkB family protein [Pedobacter sp. SYP-B3415]|uniref:YihY/virulence factor BrkB family protein n=1 Tax=Pedobacter sp. SYP-B3415 TaxID=2496641 RepID=UPI00101CF7DB|nr:YihY/virulence factor BrkB family protein [Pedobacter sp. SYP-B3415]
MTTINKIKKFGTNTYQLLAAAGKGFSEDRVMKLSAALAYYTLFSLTPLLLIILSVTSILYKEEALEGKLFGEINEFVGAEAAAQIQGFVNNANLSGKSSIGLIIGIVTLIMGATAIFIEIQDSINMIWKVKAVPKKGWKKLITNRLLSFSLIVSMGFLLLVSLVINSIVLSFGDKIQRFLHRYIPEIDSTTTFIVMLVNNVLTFAVVTTIFAIIFKVLPDVVLRWKSALVGAGFTALLFGLGKWAIGIYLEKSNPGLAFGAAGSIIVILTWIYYTAVILYFGAEFTQAFAEKFDEGIKPTKYAVHLKTVIIEKEVSELPPQHPEETTES